MSVPSLIRLCGCSLVSQAVWQSRNDDTLVVNGTFWLAQDQKSNFIKKATDRQEIQAVSTKSTLLAKGIFYERNERVAF